jgi:hypothetical protein
MTANGMDAQDEILEQRWQEAAAKWLKEKISLKCTA